MSNRDLPAFLTRQLDIAPRAARWLLLTLIFVGVLAAELLRSGTSPIAWTDTFNDTREVERCLDRDQCSLYGVPSSVPGQSHAVAWIQWRTLWTWLGLGPDGTHLSLQVLDALAAVLLFELARRCGGWLAGAIALWIYLGEVGHLTIRATALYNTRPLPFLGTALLLTCTSLARHPTRRNILLAAFVAGLMANVHLACVTTGLSVVLLTGAATGFDPRRVLFAAAAFGTLTVAMAPPSWAANVLHLLQHPSGNGPGGGLQIQPNDIVWWTGFALAAWLLLRLLRGPAISRYRQQVQGGFAITLPFLTVYLLAPILHLDPNPKYLAHLGAACALTAALPFVLFGHAAFSVCLGHRRAGRWMDTVAITAILVVSLHAPIAAWTGAALDQTPTLRDLQETSAALAASGWGVTAMIQGVKAVDSIAVLTHLGWMNRGLSPISSMVDGRAAILLTLTPDELPDPLPEGWRVLHRSIAGASVLIQTPGRLDWSHFEVCVVDSRGESRCHPSALEPATGDSTFQVPQMPWPSPQTRRLLRLRIPLRPTEDPAPVELFLPRLPAICGGRIHSLDALDATVADDQRHAVIRSPQAAVLEIDWDLFGPDCAGTAYDGTPPFFVEGDTTTVRVLSDILRRREDVAAKDGTNRMTHRTAGRARRSFAHMRRTSRRRVCELERSTAGSSVGERLPTDRATLPLHEQADVSRSMALTLSGLEVGLLAAAIAVALRELSPERLKA